MCIRNRGLHALVCLLESEGRLRGVFQEHTCPVLRIVAEQPFLQMRCLVTQCISRCAQESQMPKNPATWRQLPADSSAYSRWLGERSTLHPAPPWSHFIGNAKQIKFSSCSKPCNQTGLKKAHSPRCCL